MLEVITTIEQVTPAWLTLILRREGVLGEGIVTSVQSQANAAFNSHIHHLHLTYSPDAPVAAPTRLLLKCNLKAAWGVRAGAREAGFYTLVSPFTRELSMLAHCYDAVVSAESGDSHILLHDLSDTHTPPLSRDQTIAGNSVPSTHHLEQVIDAVARFHACWWDHPLLKQGAIQIADWCRDQVHYADYIERLKSEWAAFMKDEGDWFPVDLAAQYEHALAHLSHLWQRTLARRISTFTNLMLIHNDCYFSNFLCPNDPLQATTCLIDFQGPSVEFCAGDLVNLLATWWTPAQRQAEQREERSLRRYYQRLLAHGVNDYAWDDLLDDYRLMLVLWSFVPIWDQTNGSSKSYWWPKLQCLAGAYQDFQCADWLEK